METLSTSSTSNPPCRIEMVFRFWTPAKSADAREGESVNRLPSMLALIEDVAAAKRGTVLAGREQLSIAGLRDASDALVVSRQIQHGLQGFRRKSAEPVAVSIAINACAVSPAEDPSASEGHEAQPTHDLVSLLRITKPAQVLVTHDLSEQIKAYKGLPLRSFPSRFGVSEYLWTSEEKLDQLQSEPQLTLTTVTLPALMQKPPKEPAPAPAAVPAAQPAPAAAADPAPPNEMPPDEMPPALPVFRSFEQPEGSWWTALGDRKKIAAVAAAVVVFSLGLWGLYTAFRSSMKVPAPADKPASAVIPGTSPGTVPQAVTHAATPPAKTAPEKEKPKSLLQQVFNRTAPAEAKRSGCQLENAEIPGYLRRAEDMREQRQYASAVYLFQKVVACEPGNREAQTGLDRAKAAQQDTQ